MSTTAVLENRSGACALLDPVQLLTTEQRKAYWRHYEEWTLQASDDELNQLQRALEEHETADVQSLVKLMRNVAMNECERTKFPASFVRPFADPTWMRSRVH